MKGEYLEGFIIDNDTQDRYPVISALPLIEGEQYVFDVIGSTAHIVFDYRLIIERKLLDASRVIMSSTGLVPSISKLSEECSELATAITQGINKEKDCKDSILLELVDVLLVSKVVFDSLSEHDLVRMIEILERKSEKIDINIAKYGTLCSFSGEIVGFK